MANRNTPIHNRIRIIALGTIAVMLITSGCGDSETRLDKKRYDKAVHLVNSKQFNQAKLVLDTIIDGKQHNGEYKKLAAKLMEQVAFEEQKQNLVFLDSLLNEKVNQLKPLMKNFVADSVDGMPTKLVHIRQKTSNSYNRSFIKPNLDEQGNFYISSQYCGQSAIEHTFIKVFANGNSVESEKIEFDDFLNRRYSDASYKWEVIQFKDGKDNGIVDFIAQNADKQIKLQFAGKTTYAIYIESFDKEAIRDSYEISFILKEIARIKVEKEKAQRLIEKIKQ